MDTTTRDAVREGLSLLGVRRLLLGVFDAAFPSEPDEDLGRGTPYSRGAARVLALASALGFDGLQLGPQGATSAVNPSPYDGALFSRSPLALALAPLVRPGEGRLLAEARLEGLLWRGDPGRVAYGHAFRAARRATVAICAAWRARRASGALPPDHPLVPDGDALARFREEHAGWLVPDALHDVLQREHGGRHFSGWPELDRRLLAAPPTLARAAAARRAELMGRHATALEDHALVQALLARQHAAWRGEAARLGLSLFADLQAGLSERDAWATQALHLPGYRMGAPPSRTNPAGQAWGYPVLDPRLRRAADGGDGPVLAHVRARARRTFAEFDGARVDHPHALVCPWVYRDGPGPGDEAVRGGARLLESPALPDHPALAPLALARAGQIDPSVPRHDDRWVRALDAGQVERYAVLVEAVLEEARAAGRAREDVACEILSTMPYPLGRVIERHGLGRFRVTQKADLSRPDDVYRGENAGPEDWIMLGNHDTRPILAVAREWARDGRGRAQAEYLATRLVPDRAARAAFVARTAGDPAALAQARLADLFVGPARSVLVFFTDLLGETEPYNRPGLVAEENWSLRLPRDPAAALAARLRERRALDVPRAVAAALCSRGDTFARTHAALVARLERGP